MVWLSVIVMPLFGSYKTYKMPAASMENVLIPGDRMIADLAAYVNSGPDRGDVVIFIFPVDGVTSYVKRCVGIPGDTVLIADKQLRINGEPFVEPPTIKYIDTTSNGGQVIQPRREGGMSSRDNFGPYVVPADSYFMMGDNRDNSADSRYWGVVSRDMILGRAVRVYYSPDWSRIGQAIE